MAAKPPPPKPWERTGGPASSPPGTDDSGPKPWERPADATINSPASTSGALAERARPWDTASYGGGGAYSSYGNNTYGSTMGSGSYSSPYGGSMFGRPAGSYGSAGGMYGSSYGASPFGSSYSSPYGSQYGSQYGAGYGSSYGGGAGHGGSSYGMYNRPYGSPYGGGAGMGMGYGGALGAPGAMDPGAPTPPPSSWQSMLTAIGGVVGFFGRLSFLVDENAHALNFFMSSLLQLLDRAGSLYGELARFVLRLLGYKPKPQAGAKGPGQGPPGPPGHPGPGQHAMVPGSGQWDGVWGRPT